jgi:hypothetical protein
LICVYVIYRNIQTYREKVIMSGGIANRCARAMGLEKMKSIAGSSLEELASFLSQA